MKDVAEGVTVGDVECPSAEGTEPIGDKQDEAVELLEDFIELNY